MFVNLINQELFLWLRFSASKQNKKQQQHQQKQFCWIGMGFAFVVSNFFTHLYYHNICLHFPYLLSSICPSWGTGRQKGSSILLCLWPVGQVIPRFGPSSSCRPRGRDVRCFWPSPLYFSGGIPSEGLPCDVGGRLTHRMADLFQAAF